MSLGFLVKNIIKDLDAVIEITDIEVSDTKILQVIIVPGISLLSCFKNIFQRIFIVVHRVVDKTHFIDPIGFFRIQFNGLLEKWYSLFVVHHICIAMCNQVRNFCIGWIFFSGCI